MLADRLMSDVYLSNACLHDHVTGQPVNVQSFTNKLGNRLELLHFYRSATLDSRVESLDLDGEIFPNKMY